MLLLFISRFSKLNLLYDFIIEKTVKWLRIETKEKRKQNMSDSRTALVAQREPISISDISTLDVAKDSFAQKEPISEDESTREVNHDFIPVVEDEMEVNDPRLYELSSHEKDDPPIPIQMLELNTPIVVKLALLHTFLKFSLK